MLALRRSPCYVELSIHSRSGGCHARIPRLLMSETPTVYHVISRTALPGLPFDASDKDFLQSLTLRFSRIYFTEILGFCPMDNLFHLLVRMFPEDHGETASLRQRFKLAHGGKLVMRYCSKATLHEHKIYQALKISPVPLSKTKTTQM